MERSRTEPQAYCVESKFSVRVEVLVIPTLMIGWLFVLNEKYPVSAVKSKDSYRKDSQSYRACSQAGN